MTTHLLSARDKAQQYQQTRNLATCDYSGIRRRAREAHQRYYLERYDTVEIPVARITGELPCPLPLDEAGRPCLYSHEHTTPTSLLVADQAYTFSEAMGEYPPEILLSAFRFFTYGRIWQYYYPPTPGAAPIPYSYEPGGLYEVLCRGRSYKRER